MPVDESFWNPYRMIQVGDRIKKESPVTDEKFNGHNGMLTCSLTNLTSLYIGGNRNEYHKNRTFLKRKDSGKFVIPGSSLKGLIRSTSEIVGNGCMVTDKNNACNQINSLCIACRMFGMMERKQHASVHKGKISFSDAIILEDSPSTKSFEVYLSSCGTRHEPFYRTPETGKLDNKSRKLYFHQPKRTESVPSLSTVIKSKAWNINALLPGHNFDFTVQFSNLTEQELSVLIYALTLEENVTVNIKDNNQQLSGPLRHKLGNAKPLGLGSCCIRIKKLLMHKDPNQRFASLINHYNDEYADENLKEYISNKIQPFIKDRSNTMQQFRKMMIWDENDDRVFKYPDYNWFQNSENSQKTLKHI
ncbi:protein containing DUF324 [Candidatus Magnetomorum sp. HK-1]|nr:protein containing DUF324 [Candidatus Magnetomorum sp. HK-1]